MDKIDEFLLFCIFALILSFIFDIVRYKKKMIESFIKNNYIVISDKYFKLRLAMNSAKWICLSILISKFRYFEKSYVFLCWLLIISAIFEYPIRPISIFKRYIKSREEP